MTDLIAVSCWLEESPEARHAWAVDIITKFLPEAPMPGDQHVAWALAEFIGRVNDLLPPGFTFVVSLSEGRATFGRVVGGRFVDIAAPSDFVRLAQAIAIVVNTQEAQRGASPQQPISNDVNPPKEEQNDQAA